MTCGKVKSNGEPDPSCPDVKNQPKPIVKPQIKEKELVPV